MFSTSFTFESQNLKKIWVIHNNLEELGLQLLTNLNTGWWIEDVYLQCVSKGWCALNWTLKNTRVTTLYWLWLNKQEKNFKILILVVKIIVYMTKAYLNLYLKKITKMFN